MEYNNNLDYPSLKFRYVPYSELFDEKEDDFETHMMRNDITFQDYGPQPYSVNIDEATKENNNFRRALWTGNHLQITLMSINVGDDIGLEIHPDTDQFIRIEDGQGKVRMGKNKENLEYKANVSDGSAIMIPAGTWHNVINTGNKPLKVYSIYAPPHHPRGIVQPTKTAD